MSKGVPLFITGTGTGVGKTVLTALLLAHALKKGILARALKPFSSGDRSDAMLLWDLQSRSCSLDELNPWCFSRPVSPWTAARLENKAVHLHDTLEYLQDQQRQCDLLIAEGAGGLLSPLGEGFSALDLIQNLQARVVVVAPNRLGVINEVLLTLIPLAGISSVHVALMEQASPDASAKTNFEDLRLLTSRPIVSIPFFQEFVAEASVVRERAALLENTLSLWA